MLAVGVAALGATIMSTPVVHIAALLVFASPNRPLFDIHPTFVSRQGVYGDQMPLFEDEDSILGDPDIERINVCLFRRMGFVHVGLCLTWHH
jgi:hypothetical protein